MSHRTAKDLYFEVNRKSQVSKSNLFVNVAIARIFFEIDFVPIS